MLTKEIKEIKVRLIYPQTTQEKHYFPAIINNFYMPNSWYFAICIQTIDLEWILQSNGIHFNEYSKRDSEVSSVCML